MSNRRRTSASNSSCRSRRWRRKPVEKAEQKIDRDRRNKILLSRRRRQWPLSIIVVILLIVSAIAANAAAAAAVVVLVITVFVAVGLIVSVNSQLEVLLASFLLPCCWLLCCPNFFFRCVVGCSVVRISSEIAAGCARQRQTDKAIDLLVLPLIIPICFLATD